MQNVADIFENRLRHRRQGHRRNVGMTERKHAGPEMIMPAVVGTSEAKLRKRIKATPHRSPRETCLRADLRNGEFALALRKSLNHGEPSRQRSHKIGIAAVFVNLR